MKTNPNDRVFPVQLNRESPYIAINTGELQLYDGVTGTLTKREFFATMALMGKCSDHGMGYTSKVMAKESVEAADALIEALNEGESGEV